MVARRAADKEPRGECAAAPIGSPTLSKAALVLALAGAAISTALIAPIKADTARTARSSSAHTGMQQWRYLRARLIARMRRATATDTHMIEIGAIAIASVAGARGPSSVAISLQRSILNY